MSTQRDRVLRLLTARGNTGVCAVDFLGPEVADGGAPITRLAARVHELREDGVPIRKNGQRNSCDVYVLARPQARPAPPGPTPEAVGLFDPVDTHRPASPYDDIAA